MTREEFAESIKHDPRQRRIFDAIMKATTFRDIRDFMKFWDFIIQGFEYDAYHRGIKEAERVLKAGKGQPNVK